MKASDKEKLIGKTINVLDHGFVRLVDFMGDDERILESARISYKSKGKGEEADRKLISYLWKNKHTSPFEMVKITLNIKMPIFIMRQYIRHRMQNCLSGDNFLYFDVPNALKKINKHGTTRRCLYKYSIREFHDKFHSNKRNQYSVNKMKLRYYNEDTKTIESTNVTDIWEVGKKDVYEIEMENGYKVKSTLDHRFLTTSGYRSLTEAIDIRLQNKIPISWKNTEIFMCNGTDLYKSKDFLMSGVLKAKTQKEIGEEAGVSCHTIKKWMRKLDVKYPINIIGAISSKSQIGRKRGTRKNIKPLSPQALQNIKMARSGNRSNFWKGGVSKFNIQNRINNVEYNRWKYNVIQNLIRENKFVCCISGEKSNLVLHHIIPIWKDSSRYMDENNVIAIRKDLHKNIHKWNLEEKFIEYINDKKDMRNFFSENDKQIASKEKSNCYKNRGSRKSKITVVGSKIKSIKYIGEEIVYDLSVSNQYHNFICNGMVVHNCNEVSARYTALPNEFYIPEKWRKQDIKNKQGSEVEENWDNANNSLISVDENPLGLTVNEHFSMLLNAHCHASYDLYEDMLSKGVAREMARMVLPINIYTEIYACWDLKNLLHFISLRDDSHAQAEIQEYGKAIKEICKDIVPWTLSAYEECKKKES